MDTCPVCGAEAGTGSSACAGCGGSSALSRSPTGSLDGATVHAAPPPELEPGATFGPRYEIRRQLGEGGMGTVYEAYDRELDRTVALKLLHAHRGGDIRSVQRFKQELLLARAVSHRNILRIHDLGDVDGIKFISMEHVDGENLHAVLKRDGPLPLDRALVLARQLCQALQAAHDAGVLHRDLKPQNVLVDRADHVYVSDFGLAKSLGEGDEGLTRTGDVLGTPRYMSPEQVEGKPLDRRSDLYALGLVLYEMLTGTPPFSGASPTEQMLQRIKERPRDPRTCRPDLPEHLRAAVLKCLERQPQARYGSAAELLADLERPASFGARARFRSVLARRRRVAATVLAAGALIALAGPGIRERVAAWRSERAVTTTRPRIAVLPFRVLEGDDALAHLGAGLADSLSAKLFAIESLTVAPASAVERAAKKESLEAAGRDLGAQLLVTGSLQRAGDKVRLVAAVDDVGDGRRLWSGEFRFVPADLLAFEDRLFGELLQALGLGVSSDAQSRAEAGFTENLEAYDWYLRGRNAMRGEQDAENVRAAVGFYEQALAKDPRFALAYAGLATASLRMYRLSSETAWADRAVSAAEQARGIAEDLVEVRVAAAGVYQATGRTMEAIGELRRATSLAPKSDDAHRRLGRAYLAGGHKVEALAALQRAVALNPYHWVNHSSLGFAHWSLGDYEQAAASYRRIVELEPNSALGHNDLGAAYLTMGRFDEAAVAFQQALRLEPNADTFSNLGFAHAYSGRFAEAVAMFEKAAELRPQGHVHVGNLADGYRWAGSREEAQRAYERAIALAHQELRVNPRDALVKTRLAVYHAKRGEHARARRWIDDARQLNPTDHRVLYEEAVVHALAGRVPEAVAALDRALQAGIQVAFVDADPNLASVRSDPRYAELKRARTVTASKR